MDESDFYHELTKRIIALRESKGWTYQLVALWSGHRNRHIVSAMEDQAKVRKVSLRYFVGLASAYEMDLELRFVPRRK